MRVLFWVVALLAVLVLVLFAVSNREAVAVGLWPLSYLLNAPLYLVVLLTLLVGFVGGELAGWIGGRHSRREARAGRRRIAALESELAATQAQLAPPVPLAAPAAAGLPVGPIAYDPRRQDLRAVER